MSSRLVTIGDALVERIKTIPSYSSLGQVHLGARHPMQVRDAPSVDVWIDGEAREQQSSFQAKVTATWMVAVHGRRDELQRTLEIMGEIENVIRDELTLGGAVTSAYAGDLEALYGDMVGKDFVGEYVVRQILVRYHQTEM